MTSPSSDPFEAWTKPGTDMFTYWISHFPTAPMFGVEWRYAELLQPAPGAKPKPAPKAATKPASKPAPKPQSAEPKAEPVALKDAPAPEAAKPSARKPAVEAPAATTIAPKAAPAKAKAVEAKAVEAKAVETKAVETKRVQAKPSDAKPSDAKPSNTRTSDAKPVAPAKPAAAVVPAKPDDLKRISGIGPGLEKQLNALGVHRFDQIAGMTDADLQKIDDQLTAFNGRCFRDDWIGQAKALLAG